MKLRVPSIVDVAVVVVVLVALILPPRKVSAVPVTRVDDDARRALAFAEARVQADPGNGQAVYDLVRQLGEAKQADWAVQAAGEALARAPASPTRWRALLALSMAHIDRYEAKPALEYASLALAACEATAATCPSWEQLHVELHQRYLAAGVKSGIDPRKDPRGFVAAGERELRQVRATGTGVAPQPAPPPPPGSGSSSPTP